MNELVVAIGSFFVGCVAAGALCGITVRRWLLRLEQARHVAETAAQLEKRRLALDSTRRHQPRDGAGQPARVVDAMPRVPTRLSTIKIGSKTSQKKIGEKGGHPRR